MKTTTIYMTSLALAATLSFCACEKNLTPDDSKADTEFPLTPEDYQMATYGHYALLVDAKYTRQFHFLSEYKSDNVALASSTTDPLLNAYNYNHYPAMSSTRDFWEQSYKLIFAANKVIERIEDGTSNVLDQIKGENLYLRAMAHFNLVTFFGRPYAQNNGESPGIVIKDNTANDFPARSSVKAVYDFIIADLVHAADLMNQPKNACYASKEVAYALLSRVLLHKGDFEGAVNYANQVIDSKRYTLVGTAGLKNYFTLVPENNTETIFAVRHTVNENREFSSISGMYYNDPVTRSTGWAQMSASLSYVDLLNKYPEDARHGFIVPLLDETGNIEKLYGGSTPCYMVTKYSFQEGVVNLSSPVYIRLAEVYLNRAEAYAKLGNDEAALSDVNVIRSRAGLSGDALYQLSNLKGHERVLDVVLEERRLELAFEGFRAFDLFRNNLPMVRDYPGFHGDDRIHQTVQPTDDRVVYYIPERELNVNPNLTQNP